MRYDPGTRLQPTEHPELLQNIQEAQRRITKAKAELGHWVTMAHRYGYSWQEIGDALGLSRQAAHNAYKHARTLTAHQVHRQDPKYRRTTTN